MNRRHAVAVLALVALACSSDDASPPPKPFTGIVLGNRFEPVDGAGFIMGPMACAPLGDGETHAQVFVKFSSSPGVCELENAVAFCGEKAGSTVAFLAVTRSKVNGGPVEPIGPGQYFAPGMNVVDANGVLVHGAADSYVYDATCNGTTNKEGGTGWITFDEVGPTRIRGSAELTFLNGDALSGAFDVPVCESSDAAQCASQKGGCTSFTCVP